MEFRIQLDPGIAAAEHRTVFESIPPEYKEIYLAHLSPKLAEIASGQIIHTEPALEVA